MGDSSEGLIKTGRSLKITSSKDKNSPSQFLRKHAEISEDSAKHEAQGSAPVEKGIVYEVET